MAIKKGTTWSSIFAAAVVVLMAGSPARLDSTVPAAKKIHQPAPRPKRRPAAKLSQEECLGLATKAALAKARAELGEVMGGSPDDLQAVSAALASSSKASEQIRRTFAASELIVSEYSAKRECVVTVKLPIERLRSLSL